MKLILASSSPRRSEILRDAGISFEVSAADVDESVRSGESAKEMVARLAESKSRAIASQRMDPTNFADPPCIVIGADTSVELDGKIFGKPTDAEHAGKMLATLAGQTHLVHTGIFLLRLPDGATRHAVESTSVKFVSPMADAIEDYVATGEPLGKAGGYAIQGRGGRFISEIEGCYFNVVGLPLAKLCALLRELGWQDRIRSD